MSDSDLNVSRSVLFNIKSAEGSGLQFLVGRASQKDPDRYAQPDNFLFNEKSLSKAMLFFASKKLRTTYDGPFTQFVDQFRISVEDLGSTHGIVDLHSQDADARVIDLKNGERFGLVKLTRPLVPGQSRGAKLKFRVLINRGISEDDETCELSLQNVTNEDSPYFSRPSTMDRIDIDLPPSPSPFSTSSSEMNYSEDLVLEIEENHRIETDVDIDDQNIREEVVSDTCSAKQESDHEVQDDTIAAKRELSTQDSVSASGEEYDDFSDDTYELLTEFKHRMETTPQCYDCCESRVSFINDLEGSSSSSQTKLSSEMQRKRSYEDDQISITHADQKRKKSDPNLPVDVLPTIGKKKLLIGSLLGFMAGSLSTLGVLVGIANLE